MISFSTDDLKTPESVERVLRQFEAAIRKSVSVVAPSLSQTVAQLAPIIRKELQAGGIAPLNLQSLLPASAFGGVPVIDTHANRLTVYPAGNYSPGQLFYETDRTVFYIVNSVSGSLQWVFAGGVSQTLSSAMVTGLGTNDNGFLLDVSDYSHLLQWTGSGWQWAPGDDGSGFYRMYETAPSSGFGANAWQLCNGSTVDRFNPDGTMTSVTVIDVTTAVYLKGALAAAGIAGASGNAFTGTPASTSTEGAAGTTVDNTLAGSTIVVAAHPHIHDFTPAGSNSAIELRNKQTAIYYRR